MSNSIVKILKYTKPLKLLYVEDNEEAKRFTLELLSRFFDEISVVVNGEEGLKLYQESNFDLIITDINMPVMNGIDMALKIREINEEVPIFILSAHNEKSFTTAAKEIQNSEYLSKPLELQEFINVLERRANE